MAMAIRTPFEVDLYSNVRETWPKSGRHILGTFNEDSIVLYQAYKEVIAKHAVTHQTFLNCPEFSTTRMTWLKPNFLWMMYRSGWATKHNQEHILAITITREGFEEILRNAKSTERGRQRRPRPELPKSGQGVGSKSKQQVDLDLHGETTPTRIHGGVRFQWDPDHGPTGDKKLRRAIQLGIKHKILERFLNEWILKIDDITEFVAQQREYIRNNQLELLRVPQEKVYILKDLSLSSRLELDKY